MANQTEEEKAKAAAEKSAAEAKVKEEQEASKQAKALENHVTQAVKGLQYRDSQGTPVLDENRKPLMRGGKEVVTYHPHVRPMTVADVVSHAIVGSALMIVSSDGMKHRVLLNGKP